MFEYLLKEDQKQAFVEIRSGQQFMVMRIYKEDAGRTIFSIEPPY